MSIASLIKETYLQLLKRDRCLLAILNAISIDPDELGAISKYRAGDFLRLTSGWQNKFVIYGISWICLINVGSR